MIQEIGANGKNGNTTGTNGTNVTNQWYHWENREHTHNYKCAVVLLYTFMFLKHSLVHYPIYLIHVLSFITTDSVFRRAIFKTGFGRI